MEVQKLHKTIRICKKWKDGIFYKRMTSVLTILNDKNGYHKTNNNNKFIF